MKSGFSREGKWGGKKKIKKILTAKYRGKRSKTAVGETERGGAQASCRKSWGKPGKRGSYKKSPERI